MKEGIVKITKAGKIANSGLGKEVIQLINKERNKLRNCNNKHERLKARHNNLMKLFEDLQRQYNELKEAGK